MRIVFLSYTFLFSLLFTEGMSQENYDLLTWKSEYTLRTHLLQKMHTQYDLRKVNIEEALESKENMLAYREECRQKYLAILGEFPEKTPLNPQIINTKKLDNYRIDNVLFESRPNHHITSNFYIPVGNGPFPAALFFCGHEMTSKATESYQKTAALFATNGIAVLVVYPMSQGERVQFTDENGQRILRGSTTEHTLLNAGANLVGNSVVKYELYDNVRSMDYLISRSEVDPGRIGCLGNSGGGTQTAYFIGFDDRVKVAAPCSYIARRERNFELSGAADGCQHIPFEGDVQLEIGDFLIMFAPKPLLILAGRYDFVDYTGSKETAEELQIVYSILREKEKFKFFTFDDGHGISKPKREAAVQWFRYWLCNDNSVIIEGNQEVLSEQELNCTPNGQVNELFPSEISVQEINLEMAKTLTENRNRFREMNDLTGYRQKIKELLSIDEKNKLVSPELTGEEFHPEYTLQKYILRKEGEIPLPVLFYEPRVSSSDNEIIIYIMEEGKSEIAANHSLIDSCMQRGVVLVLADLRGMGETEEKEDANDKKYYNREYNNAMISLHLNENLTGQRLTDLFTLLDFIEENRKYKQNPVRIFASGAAGPVALYAAVFNSQIQSLSISNSIQSYFDILNDPMGLDWYSYVVPNVLKYFDLPDLIHLRNDLMLNFTELKTEQ
ncbi:MAG: acetylxylan esterase [Bacteroidales bacterium]|nr:acetylxylan esterase [Bacteroidales bacterium]MCF8390096.1 acetylxylan esterase [Bacteroidales bacterium]